MGKYTILNDPAADKAVQDVLDMVVHGVLGLMNVHVQAIVLMGGFGRGEGGVYCTDDGYHLVNDLDLAIFVERDFKRVKQKFNSRLKELAKKLQPRARGIKQIDIDITNTWRYRFVPNLVNYYEMKQGHQVIYGNLDLAKIMPSLTATKLPVFDGTIYFYSRGSGLLLPAIYFLTNNLHLPEIRENFQIELQKACQSMGDALLLMARQYHYSYRERLRRFDIIEKNNNFVPAGLMAKVGPFYRWGVERKLNPSLEWSGSEEMIERWFNIRDVFGEFFLWFESKRLKYNFNNWIEYSDYVFRQGMFEPWDVKFREILKNGANLIRSGINNKLFFKSKKARLLPVMPLLLFSLNKDSSTNDKVYANANRKLTGKRNSDSETKWINIASDYLSIYHPSGVVEKALNLAHSDSTSQKEQ